MSRPAFNKQATPVTFDYAAEATAAYETFPHLKDRVFFMDVQSGEMVGSDLSAAERVSHTFNTKKYIDRYRELKGSCCILKPFHYVCLYLENDHSEFLGKNTPRVYEHFFAFDHELAHAAIPKASSLDPENTQAAECIADAYACIRHYQRFGTDSSGLDMLPLSRAANAFFRAEPRAPLGHFTSNVVDKIILMKDSLYLERLDAAETVNLALTMAQNFAISTDTLKNWSTRICDTTIEAVQTFGTDDALRYFAEEALTTMSPLLSKWGCNVLEALLDGTLTEINPRGEAPRAVPSLEDPYWQDMRQRVSNRRDYYPKLLDNAPVFTKHKK